MSQIKERVQRLQSLLQRITPVPADWLDPTTNNVHGPDRIEPMTCKSWRMLEDAWDLDRGGCMRWRQELADVLASMLAVAASTSQTGDQLCLQLIADPGSGKSRFCSALLVSQQCFALRHFTGFYSGSQSDDGRDLSLIARINHKTLITPEGDTLASSPIFGQLMSEMRQIYDGEGGAIYKTTDQDKDYKGIRLPWILCGTRALLDNDQSRVGDRFLRICINQPEHDEKRRIMMAAMRAQRAALRETSNGKSGGVEERMRKAYALTGGYVDHLRESMSEKIANVDCGPGAEDYLANLAELIADMRARPQVDQRKVDMHECKELPSRLASQLMRFAECLAVVLGKPEVDSEVLRIVRKVSLDSSLGRTLDIASLFFRNDAKHGKPYQKTDGLMMSMIARWSGWQEDKLLHYMTFLLKIGVAQHISTQHTHGYWKLTPRVENLWMKICT